MTLRVGDRSPKAIPIQIATGGVNGTTVASVKVKAVYPGGEVDWGTLTPTATTTTTVSCVFVLDPTGASLPKAGQYRVRAWAYSAGGALLFDTEIVDIKVESAVHTWPT